MRRLLITTALLLLSTGAQAQLDIRVRGGEVAPIPVAVIPIKLEGEGPLPPVDISSVITANLRRSGKFALLDRNDMIEQPNHANQVSYGSWRALGMDNLIVGTVRYTGQDRYRVQVQLIDVIKGTPLFQTNQDVKAGQLRSFTHKLSDVIYEKLTGEKGAFYTLMLYVDETKTEKGKRYRIMLADADGQRPEALLTSEDPFMSPAWSPDGQSFAFVSFHNQRPQVFVFNRRDRQFRPVAEFKGINSAPAWSPDGNRLALTLSRDGNTEIYVLDLRSKDFRRLTNHWAIDTEPTWSPDGRHIAFTSNRGGKAQIYKVEANGGQSERVSYEGDENLSPHYSPDGRYLAMVHRSNGRDRIAIMDLKNQQFRVLTDGPLDESPHFSPNSAMIVYGEKAGAGNRLATVSVYGKADEPIGTVSTTAREPAWGPFR